MIPKFWDYLLSQDKELKLKNIDLTKLFSGREEVESCVALTGDASNRKYYRLHTKGNSYVLMVTPPQDEDQTGENFFNTCNYLDTIEVRVPKIEHSCLKSGLFILEDLGDDTLLKVLAGVSSEKEEAHWFHKAIEALILFQHRSHATPNLDLPGFNLHFDNEKLMWEIENTIEQFFIVHLNRKIGTKSRALLTKEFTRICSELTAISPVLAHRDFHTRNLMVKGDELIFIDFQDARMGPPQYDLASLISDSYFQLSDQGKLDMIHYYYERAGADILGGGSQDAFVRGYDLMAVQRNFKAIGTFASIYNRRSDERYLKYIGNTFENLRRVLIRYDEFSDLRKALSNQYYF